MSIVGEDTRRAVLTAQDVLRHVLIDGVALAPAGDRAVIALRTADADANGYRSHLRIVPLDGSPAQPLPSGPWLDHAPSWSPDGTQIAFLSTRTGQNQVWLAALDGEVRGLTSLPLGVHGQPAWSPDGRHIAIVAVEEVEQDSGPAPIVSADSRPFLLNRATYRADGTGYLGSRYDRLLVIDVETGTATRLTDGRFNDATPSWSPDGTRLAFISNRMDERLLEFRSAVWVVPSAGGIAQCITPEDAVAFSPAWSPDGTEIAYRGLLPGLAFAPNHRLLLVPAAGGTPRSLTEGFGGHVGGGIFSDTVRSGDGGPSLFWTADGKSVRFLAADRGRISVFEVDRTGTVSPLVGGDRVCGLLSVSSDGATMAFASSDLTHLPELHVMSGDGQREQCLTDLNAWLRERLVSMPRPLAVTSAEGDAIDAWLMPPAGMERPVQGPLVLDIHGGPHSMFGHALFFDMQLLAAQGYCGPPKGQIFMFLFATDCSVLALPGESARASRRL